MAFSIHVKLEKILYSLINLSSAFIHLICITLPVGHDTGILFDPAYIFYSNWCAIDFGIFF